VIGLFRKPQTRAVDASKFGLAIDQLNDSTAGVNVTRDTALTLSAVMGSVRLLANDIGGLPIHSFKRQGGRRLPIDNPVWVEQPNPFDPNESGIDHIAQVVAAMLTDGNGIVSAGPSVDDPLELHALDARKITIAREPNGAPRYTPVGSSEGLTAHQILHIPFFRLPGEVRGISPIEMMRRGIGRGLAAEELGARYFAQGSTFGAVLEYPKDVDPDDTQVGAVLKALNKKHRGVRNAWALGAITGGGTLKELGMKPADAQMIQTEEWTLEQWARVTGIPPSMLGSQKPGAVAYASVEQRSIDYVVHAVVPIVIRLEKAYSRLLPFGSYIKFNAAALMRGDAKARAEFYATALQNKWMTRDEVRGFEELEPLGLGFLETPNNNPPRGTNDAQA